MKMSDSKCFHLFLPIFGFWGGPKFYWHQVTVQEVEAGLVAADVVAVQWCLEERQLVVAGQLVKMGVVCGSFGSTLNVDF